MPSPSMIAAELALTWQNGNRKDAVNGILQVRPKWKCALVAIQVYEILAGGPPTAFSAEHSDTGALMERLASKGE